MSNDMVEKVAQAIFKADLDPEDPCEDMPLEAAWNRDTIYAMAYAAMGVMRRDFAFARRSIRDYALEEAAKMIEDRHRFRIGSRNEPSESAKEDAAAIRALKEK